MNLNPETAVLEDMHDVKYRKPYTFYTPVVFESLKQVRVNHVVFTVMNFVNFGLYLKFFHYLERYIR